MIHIRSKIYQVLDEFLGGSDSLVCVAFAGHKKFA